MMGMWTLQVLMMVMRVAMGLVVVMGVVVMVVMVMVAMINIFGGR
jgi:hypothetical protein